MASPGQANQNILVQLLPFMLMIGIFYVLVLLPMRKRQKRVQEFQAGLKVGLVGGVGVEGFGVGLGWPFDEGGDAGAL